MSQYTIQVDQFIVNSLQPEIDALNLSLTSMEEMGYNNLAIQDTRRKLNKLLPIYDFLNEYAHGDEEADLKILQDFITLTGLSTLSGDSTQPLIQNVRSLSGINKRTIYHDERVYLNGELLLSDVIQEIESTFLIYPNQDADGITVVIRDSFDVIIGEYVGTNYVLIQDINENIRDNNYLSFNIRTEKNNKEITNKNIIYTIMAVNDCVKEDTIYYVGSAEERFTISSTDLEESSTITTNPNEGTIAGTSFDIDWIVNSGFNLANRFIFRQDSDQRAIIHAGADHMLLVVPSNLYIQTVSEVVLGQVVPMVEDIHYARMTIAGAAGSAIPYYNCIYLRDLAYINYQQDREIQFHIKDIS